MIRPGPKSLIGRNATVRIIRRRGRPEDDMLRNQVLPLFARVGVECFFTSARVKARGVTPGIADMLCFSGRHAFRFDYEGKLPGHRQDHEQLRYQEAVEAAGGVYVLGDLAVAEEFMVWLGLYKFLIRPHAVTGDRMLQPVPDRSWPLDVFWRSKQWHTTPMAKAAQDRFGWKPTVGALRKVGRRMKR